MANPFYVEPANPLQALMLGVQGYDRGRKSVKEADLEAARKEAAQVMQSGGDTRGVLARLLSAGDFQTINALGQYHNNANSVYGTPIYGTGTDGKPAIGSFDKSGTFRQIATPGFTVTPGVKTVETSQGTYVIGSKDGQPTGGMPAGAPPMPGQPPGAQPRPGFFPNDHIGKSRDTRLGQEQGEKLAGMGQAKAALDNATTNIDRMGDVIRQIGADPALGKITGVQGVFPNWPGGRAANVQARLDNLTSQVGINVLQAMREASKTGGAVGNITEREWPILQNNLAALSRVQDEKQFRTELNKLVAWGEGVKQRLKQAYDTDYGSLQKPQQMQQPQGQQQGPIRVSTPEEASRLPSGTRIILPDGSPGVVP